MGVNTWTTAVDPGQISGVGQGIVSAATPVTSMASSLQGCSVPADGFQTSDALTTLCGAWAGVVASLASSLTAIGNQIQTCGTIYAQHEAVAGRSFES